MSDRAVSEPLDTGRCPGSPESLLQSLACLPLDAAAAEVIRNVLLRAHAELHVSFEYHAARAGLLVDPGRLTRMQEVHACHFHRILPGDQATPQEDLSAEAGALHYHRGIELESTIAAYGLVLIDVASATIASGNIADPGSAVRRLLARGFLDLARFAAGYVRAIREEHRQVAAQLRDLALQDALTGLANRRLFAEQLDAALKLARRRGRRVGLLRLDIDHFKKVNDFFGHEAGDAVLVEVAHRLRCCLREADLAARVGGDEFAVIVVDVASADELARIAQRLLDMAREPMCWEGHVIGLGLSIGGTLSADGVDAKLLLRSADYALYDVKSTGRGRYGFRAAQPGRTCPAGILSDFARALGARKLRFHYQPQIDLASGAIIGIEALLRSQSSRLARVPPNELLSAIQRSNLIHRFTECTVEQVAADTQRLSQATGFRGIVAVNFSEPQLRGQDAPSAILDLASRLAELGMRLEIEVTEDTFSGPDAGHVAEILGALRSRGVLLALDDFGTGYASLAHLRTFPVDRIKVGCEFIRDMTSSAIVRNIVKAVVRLARHVPATVVAEGTETEEQVRLLRQFGCEAGQGYHFARPLPLDGLMQFVRQRLAAA